jgi:CRISPR/Cas system CMR-associated protein Cmr3 (group 5 of RAMP superfamily)
MISHRRVGTTDHRWLRAVTGGLVKGRKGQRQWSQLIFQKLRRLYGTVRDGLKKKKEEGHKQQMVTGPDLQCVGEFVVHNDKGRNLTYTRGLDGISRKTTQKHAIVETV